MSEVWPFDIKNNLSTSDTEAIRPFKCLLLMPFESRFDQIASLIEDVVTESVKQISVTYSMMQLPNIERLDWVTSSGVIQQEIWRKIKEADLIFCDITGYNPNVMFETGVCAAWKKMTQVVFIKDHFFKQQSAFDIAPIRYTEYELTSDGIEAFRKKIFKLTHDALVAFPDQQGDSPNIILPFIIDFDNTPDDLRLYTPPFAHRRITEKSLEFGSLYHFAYSWASIGKERLLYFDLHFKARFINPLVDDSWIGVGVHSQHYYANFAHILYLKRNGSIIITEPNEVSPKFYEDKLLRPSTKIDLKEYHNFHIVFDESNLTVQVDDFGPVSFSVPKMQKCLGPGLIRFQSSKSWMALKEITLESDHV
jgi:hypothetical protein